MRTFCYIVSFTLGIFALGACGLKIAKAAYEHGVGFGPEPQTSLCYLGAMAGLCLALGTIRHSFRSKMD